MIRSDNWQNSFYFRWTALPVLAHVFSWLSGWSGLFLFPILVTAAQYFIFKVHPAVARPGYWFITLPITFFVWVKWGPYVSYVYEHNIKQGVGAYYAGQLVNALFIPLIIKEGKPELLLNWIISNLAALVIWLVLYDLVVANWLGDKSKAAGNLAMLVIYPAIALIANAVSGFLFTRSYIAT